MCSSPGARSLREGAGVRVDHARVRAPASLQGVHGGAGGAVHACASPLQEAQEGARPATSLALALTLRVGQFAVVSRNVVLVVE